VKTRYEWAGGQAAFARLIDAVPDRVGADDLFAGVFPGGVTTGHRHLAFGVE
jgi:hemoglobin